MAIGLSGLISGASTDALIEKILELELRRLESREATQKKLEAKQKAWSDVRSALSAIQSKTDSLRMPFIYRSRKVTLTDESVAAITASQGAALTSYSLAVLSLAQTHVLSQSDAGMKADPNVQLGTSGTFLIGTDPSDMKTITVEATDTLHSLADKINAAKAGVRANVIKVGTDGYRIVLTAEKSGTANRIRLEETSGSPLRDLGFLTDAGELANELSRAQDAVFRLNGIEYTRSTNTIDDAVPGLTITLKKVTGADAPVQATVDLDPDQIVEAVKGWVDAVNKALDLIGNLTRYNSDTGESGILSGEYQLRQIQTKLRSLVYSKVSGLPHGWQTLLDVGISTGAYGSANYGKLVVDEVKLKEALTTDAESVAKLFGAQQNNVALLPGTTVKVYGTTDGQGRLEDLINGVTDSSRFGTTGGGWEGVGAPDPGNPHIIEITFPEARTIDEITLYQPTNLSTLKDFVLEYWDAASGQWRTLKSVTDYSGTIYTAGFDPVTTTKVRLSVTATRGGEPVRLTEIQVDEYNTGAAIETHRYLRRLLDVESGLVENREQTLSQQIKRIKDAIDRMEERLLARQEQLKKQFRQMEEALAKIQLQGSGLAAILSMYSSY